MDDAIQTAKVRRRDTFLIESLKKVVDGIAGTFGPRCEVVLHDLRNVRNLDHSIIKIENGHVTGRTVGGPISDRGLKDVRSGAEEDLFINYPSVTKDGRLLKSSTIIFRDRRGKPVVSMCINFDITDIIGFNTAIQDTFAISEEPRRGEPPEVFGSDIAATLDEIANRAVRKIGKAIPSMTAKDRAEVVRQLDDGGYFLVKGAVKFLAGKLNVSKFTIYRYLEHYRRNS